MPPLVKKYSIGKNRMLKGFMKGFTADADGVLNTIEDHPRHTLILGHIDGSERDCVWGRLAFEFNADSDMVLVVRAFASNDLEFVRNGEIVTFDAFLLDESEPLSNKERLFEAVKASRFSDTDDMLLYGQKGRYLWIFVDVYGAGAASIRDMNIYLPGDIFMITFPEIYRKEGEFFHRYLSIFSSIYTDFQRTIDSLDKLIDIDTAPDGLLPVFARWLGIEIGAGIIESGLLRKLISRAYSLLRIKGTKDAIMGIVKVFTDADAYIVEQRMLLSNSSTEDRETFMNLYGKGPFEFAVLINREADEELRSRLMLLINQFKPARSEVRIVFLGEACRIGGYCYSDINARITEAKGGVLDDSKSALNGLAFLQ